MKRQTTDLNMSGLIGAKEFKAADGMKYMSVINNSDYSIEIYGDSRRAEDTNFKDTIGFIPPRKQNTIPLDERRTYTFIYSAANAGGQAKAIIYFTDESLGLVGDLSVGTGVQQVAIGSDSVGLVRRSQLPTTLTSAGNLATEILNIVKVQMDGVMQVEITKSIPLVLDGDISFDGDVGVTEIKTPVKLDTSSTALDGFSLSATTNAVQLASQVCREVMLQADPDNTADVRIGGVNSQVFKLQPGAVLVFPVKNASSLWVRTDSGTQALYGIWRD